MKKLIISLLLLFAVALPSQSFSADNNRTAHPFGFYVSLLGDPFPSLFGINLGYNLAPWARLAAGYGSVSGSVINTSLQTVNVTITTIAGGLKFMLPDANFTPVVGINYGTVSVTATGGALTSAFNGFTSSGTILSATLGLDWTSSGGFNFGAGYNLALSGTTGGAPYLALGYFF